MGHPLVERVVAERKRHAWSVRRAAAEGGISNQTWGDFEKSGKLGDAMQLGVARAFGWPTDWADDPPPTATAAVDESVLAFATAAALVADRNNALLDTLSEKMDRVLSLLLELRDRPQVPHPAEQVFDAAP